MLSGRPTAAFLGLALALILGGCGVRNEWTEADRLFRANKYAEAAEAYAAAAQKHPERRELDFNTACALHAGGQLEDAVEQFQKLARETSGQLQQKSEYNAGNGYLLQQKSQDAIEHYKRALYLESTDIDAKWNLELAQHSQQQQPQQKQQQKQKQDENGQRGQDGRPQQQDQQQNDEQEPQQQASPDASEEQQQGPRPDMQTDPGEMSQREAERLLSGLAEQDKELQKALRKPKQIMQPAPGGKDW